MAWILAILWSLPQLYVWRTINVSEEWVQCSDIWLIYAHEKPQNSTLEDPFPYNNFTQQFYNVTHLILVFYGPLLMLLVSYVIIAVKLMQYSISDPHIAVGLKFFAIKY